MIESVEGFTWKHPLEGLPLRRGTDPRWPEVALGDLDSLLIDHAFCEYKAANTALGMTVRFPEFPALVRPMIAIAQEELVHFRQVVDLLERRGLTLPIPHGDPYVRQLRERFSSEGKGIGGLGDLLLVCAFVEARSCERFRILARALAESGDRAELARFYARLAEAEGRHWETFRDLACQALDPRRVERRIEELAEIEAEVIRELPLEARMH